MRVRTGNIVGWLFICVLVVSTTYSMGLGANEVKTVDVLVDTATTKSAGIGFGHLTEDKVFDLKVNLKATAPKKLSSSRVFEQGGRVLFAPLSTSTPEGAATHTYQAAGIKPNYRHAARFDGSLKKAGVGGGQPATDFDTYLSDLDLDVDSDNNGDPLTKRLPDGSDGEDRFEFVTGDGAPDPAVGLRAKTDDIIAVRVKLNKKKDGALTVTGVTFYQTAQCAQEATWSVTEAVKPAGQTTFMKVTTNKIITATFTPGGTGNKGVGADATGKTVDKVNIIQETGVVTFSPNPIVTGYTNPAGESTLKKTVVVTVTPKTDVDDVTFRVKGGTQNRIKDIVVGQPDTETGKVTLSILGNTTTPANKPYGDTTIEVVKGEVVVGEVQVIVVIPDRIGRPHPEPDGVVQAENVAWDETTSPPAGAPAGKVFLVTYYPQWLVVPVWDQFGNTLGPIYGDASVPVEEQFGGAWHHINQEMRTDGTYLDALSAVFPKPGGYEVDKGSPAHVAWPTDPKVPLVVGSSSTNLPVRVGGHELVGGTGNRTITATPPTSIKIVWP